MSTGTVQYNADNAAMICYGSQSFSGDGGRGGTSGSNYVWLVHSDGSGSKVFPSKVREVLSRTVTPAAISGAPEYGQWTRELVATEEGDILMSNATVSINGSIWAQAACFFRIRRGAPLMQLFAKFRPHRLAVNSRMPVFSTRADVLSADELEDYGVSLRASWLAAYCDQEEVDEVYDLVVVAAGSDRPEMVRIETSAGEVSQPVPAQSRRRIRIRRG